MMRLPGPLDKETECEVETVIGCAIEVHRTLGPGFLESIYRNALCLELAANGISFELEKPVVVKYRDVAVAIHRIDLVVRSKVIVELKSVSYLQPIHHAQLLSYLRATGMRVGLLMNFGASTLRAGLKRVVL
jgi:GxxExxY protein